MNEHLTVHDLQIVVVAQLHNPSILNPDWLIRRGIVKQEWGWELKQAPICTPPLSQVTYDSGVAILAQPERVIFSETNGEALPDASRMPAIAEAYVSQLPEVTYTAVGVNATGHVAFASSGEAQEYIKSRFIKSGRWDDFDGGVSQARVHFTFKAERAKINVAIQEGRYEPAERPAATAVLFSCNTHRDLEEGKLDERHQRLIQAISNWRSDYDRYLKLVRDFLL